MRHLATVADRNGRVIERVENPRALDRNRARLRHLRRARSRCTPGSVPYRRRTEAISALNSRIANQRSHAMHVVTTRLAKSHGTMMVETLNVSPKIGQKHSPGARRRRRHLADAPACVTWAISNWQENASCHWRKTQVACTSYASPTVSPWLRPDPSTITHQLWRPCRIPARD